MRVLRICLFGSMQIVYPGRPAEAKISRTAQKLLAYLVLQRHRSHPREVLIDLFWGDHSEERARSCLSTALWRLRAVLEPEGVERGLYLMTTSTGEISFNRESDYWLDVATLEEAAGRVLAQPIEALEAWLVQELDRALQLYKGELLEGFYDDWALRERERLHRLYLNCLAYLMHYHKYHEDYEASLACGQQILQCDPLREEIHREVMRLYLASGQRALAARQYERCGEILAAELGITPMPETQMLLAQIRQAIGPDQALATPANDQSSLQPLLQQLRLALQEVERSRERLRQIIQLAEQFTRRQS